MLLQPLVFLLQPPKAALVVPHAPASRGRLCCHGGLTAPTIPTAGQALRRRQPHTAAEPVNPRTPLRAGFPCSVFPAPRRPFLGLAIVHYPGALGAKWSTWSRNDFHRTWTVHGEADSWDPPDGPPYFMKKMFPPDCWDPPATSSHARKCVRAKKRFTPLTAGTH